MKWPDPKVVWKAIEVYVEVAYGGPPPSAVRSRLETLRALGAESFYDSAVFEHRGEGMTARVLLRLGRFFFLRGGPTGRSAFSGVGVDLFLAPPVVRGRRPQGRFELFAIRSVGAG